MRVVLWDVDGTLLLNAANAGSLYAAAFEDVVGRHPAGSGAAEHGKTDAGIIDERLAALGLDTSRRAAISHRLDELSVALNRGATARRPVPGVAAALDAAAAAGWTNALLTGNSPVRAAAKLAGAGIDPDRFDAARSFFGHETPVRADLARAARHALGDAPTVIVGDTPSDGTAADAAGIPFIAVATGVFSEPTLRLTSAITVLPDLERGLPALLAALASLAAATPEIRSTLGDPGPERRGTGL